MANEEKEGNRSGHQRSPPLICHFEILGLQSFRKHGRFLTRGHAGHMDQLVVGEQRALKTIERLLPRILAGCCHVEATLWPSLAVAVDLFVPCSPTPPVQDHESRKKFGANSFVEQVAK